MSKGIKITLYVLLGVLLAGKATDIVEGFFLSPGFLAVCIALPLGVLSLVYLVVQGVRALASRGRIKFWSRLTAASVLLVLWGAPIVPGYLPRLVGYYLRVKVAGDVPAILAWADEYQPRTTSPSSQPRTEREFVQGRSLPNAIKAVGWTASIRTTDRVVTIVNGSGLTGHWGLTVGHGIAHTPEASDGWRISDDAFVWDRE